MNTLMRMEKDTRRARTHNLSNRSHASNYTQIYTGLGLMILVRLVLSVCVGLRQRARQKLSKKKTAQKSKNTR